MDRASTDTAPAGITFAGLRFDTLNTAEAVALLAARPAHAPFAYLVTPNAEFIEYAQENPAFAAALAGAILATNDSRVLARAARLRGKTLGFAPGSYIVRDLFEQGAIGPTDCLTILGATHEIAEILRARFNLTALAQHIPPMGFIHNATAVQAAIDFVEAHPARFIFIAMGAPHSELLATTIAQRGHSTGLGLCIGSSLGTLAGLNAPTPDWMERNGLVWLYRLIREPKRLWRRYLGRAAQGLVRAVLMG